MPIIEPLRWRESIAPGSCAVGAFFDDEVEALLGVDGRREFALYLASVGRV